jgi:natural product biosynthesis luciferase-like monooxygenase protein
MFARSHFSSLVIGDGPLVFACLDVLLNRGHAVQALVCTDPLIRRYAGKKGIPCFERPAELKAAFPPGSADYLFSIANLGILEADVLARARHASINFHDSLLPRHAGLHATTWALLDLAREHGVTWHLMTGQLDGGAIVKQARIPVAENETAFSLNQKCVEAGLRSFAELVEDIELSRVTAVEQDLERRTYCSHLPECWNSAVLTWSRPAVELEALVRALDFGTAPNPVAAPRLWLGEEALAVTRVAVLPRKTDVPAGTLLASPSDELHVATGTSDLAIQRVTTLEGAAMHIGSLRERFRLAPGSRLPEPSSQETAVLLEWSGRLSRHESFWVERLVNLRRLELPAFGGGIGDEAMSAGRAETTVTVPREFHCLMESEGGNPAEMMLSAFAFYLSCAAEVLEFDLDLMRGEESAPPVARALISPFVPLHIEIRDDEPFDCFHQRVSRELTLVRRHQGFFRDVFTRHPRLHGKGAGSLPAAVRWDGDPRADDSVGAPEITLELDGGLSRVRLCSSGKRAADLPRIGAQFEVLLKSIGGNPGRPLSQHSFLPETERTQLLSGWNDTLTEFPADRCPHHLMEDHVFRDPDRAAVIFRDQALSYCELNARANQLARRLQRLGVGPDVLVGIYMGRSIEMVTALLAVLKAGGAYVPLDPDYPEERIAYMLEDSRAAVVMTQEALVAQLPAVAAPVLCVDLEWKDLERESSENPESPVQPENLAYVIYTSGSTGKPKGVMVEHRNVLNFFTGMDQRLGTTPGTWLAVTSVSFDISVLEIFWTLSRGFKVVLRPDEPRKRRAAARVSDRKMEFSLSYFASDEGGDAGQKYRLLLEGAKFADAHNFTAVWTPERHFHAFGGLYPNPSVTSAAIAAVTRQVRIRAGSVVLPLHHPVRVAEEWSVVDNLSGGRVGISFAAGWQANDFVLAPENFRASKKVMLEGIEIVKRLWRGDAVVCRNGKDEEVPTRTLPRPVQAELPVWLTAAGNPETFRQAGEMGANVLTHLLGQDIAELKEKIQIYRAAFRAGGRRGHVTLMLHTFIGDDLARVREAVRRPFSDYLRSSVDLIKNAPSAFPTFKRPSLNGREGLDAGMATKFTPEDMDALVAHAFDRYFETSALFGTPESCVQRIEELKEIGVDEIACLIDFGLAADVVLNGLERLDRLRVLSNTPTETPSELANETIPTQIARHGVTHLQCTPSLARMILAEPGGGESLKRLQKLLVGGEALPASLAKELRDCVGGEIHNMYGPTETTVWSTSAKIESGSSRVSIGKPIANTEIYVLDRRAKLSPIGVAGELYIGGEGVTRGYLRRPELTAERFVANPYGPDAGGRLYRTGDLVRYLPDGNLEFLGRLDHQVKIRGHRIEIQEIERVLEKHPAVGQAVVVVHDEDAETKRLAGYVTPKEGGKLTVAELRRHVETLLPDYMAPSFLAVLSAFPLTPNGKVDRKALPAPGAERVHGEGSNWSAPQTPVERDLAEIWQTELSLPRVGTNENFFDLGGNSLLAVQIAFKLRQTFQVELPLHTFFDAPTIAALAPKVEQALMERTTEDDLEVLLSDLDLLSDDAARAMVENELLGAPRR